MGRVLVLFVLTLVLFCEGLEFVVELLAAHSEFLEFFQKGFFEFVLLLFGMLHLRFFLLFLLGGRLRGIFLDFWELLSPELWR